MISFNFMYLVIILDPPMIVMMLVMVVLLNNQLVTRYQKTSKQLKKTKVEFNFHEHIPADVSGYALVSTNK